MTPQGFCTGCRRWAKDSPHLRCPFCNAAPIGPMIAELNFPPDSGPFEQLVMVEQAIKAWIRWRSSLFALRRAIVRQILAMPPREAVEGSHHTLKTLERLAREPERGEIKRRRRTLAPEERAPRKPSDGKAARRRAAIAAHEKRLAERAALLERYPQIANRLREPLPPLREDPS